MTLTDEELDRDWKPNGRRPQSTIARSFSAELMDIFRIENSIADLDSEVEKRKQQVNTQTTELEAIERRLREMEERLKSQGIANGNAGPVSPRTQQRQALGNTFGEAPAPAQKDLPQRPMGTSRPGTAKATQQPMHGGALPPTPTASEGEYELVDPDPSSALHVRDNSGDGSSSHNVETRSFTDMVIVSKDGDRES